MDALPFTPGISVVDIDIKGSAIFYSETYDQPNGARLLAYWRDLKGDRDRPTWSEFDFLNVFYLAPLMIIKDVLDDGAEFKNRYWGTGMSEIEGIEATSMTIAEYYKQEDRAEILALYRQPLSNPTPMTMQGRLHYHEIGEWREYSAICVGFTGFGGAVSKLAIAYDL